MSKENYNIENTIFEKEILEIYLNVEGDIKSETVRALKEEYHELIPEAKEIIIFINNNKYVDENNQSVYFEQEHLSISENAQKLKEIKDREIAEEIKKSMTPGKKNTAKKSVEEDSDVLVGKLIKTPSKVIDPEFDIERKVCYEGEVYNYSEFQTKGEYTIISFSLVDDESGIGVKLFLKEKELLKYKAPKNGDFIKAFGRIGYDDYSKENILNVLSLNKSAKTSKRIDNASRKRVELKIHSSMTEMSGVDSVEKIMQTASNWGHKAIALTDEDVIHGYPSAMNAKFDKKYNISKDLKVIYGLDARVIDKSKTIVNTTENIDFNTDIVVFDIETTGLFFASDEIIEIGAVKLRNQEVVDKFSELIKPRGMVSQKTVELTGIDDSMLKDKPSIEEILPKFIDFCKNSIIVAHNATFDIGFISYAAGIQKIKFNPIVLDTLALSRMLYPDFKKHGLSNICKELGVVLSRHHRADADVSATAGVLKVMFSKLLSMGINNFKELNEYSLKYNPLKNYEKTRMTILVKDESVLPAFYEVISNAHIYNFFEKPLYNREEIQNIREGLLISSSAVKGEVIEAINKKLPHEELKKIISFYDYVEVAPPSAVIPASGYGRYGNYNQYINLIKDLMFFCKECNVPVVAVSDVYYIDRQDKENRNILMYSSSQFIKYKKSRGQELRDSMTDNFFRTTDELISEFSFLGNDSAYEIVVVNSNKIADLIPVIKPIPDGTYPPIMEGSAEELKSMCYKKAHEMYGDELHDLIAKRLDKELNSIIGNGYAVMYIIARKLVLKSNEDGYLVGSRGSVGSSFAATMSGITEVNPLPAHYYCPERKCNYVEFYEKNDILDGFDLPPKKCPLCKNILKRDGHNIPFETFLGFDGDKEPDIDLNFAGPYQSTAHAYTGVLFGDKYVYKAGTISTVQEKKAYGYVKRYYEDFDLSINKHFINKKVSTITGARNTTGQHAGGIMVVPHYKKIYDFCPVQYPSNNPNKGTITTHFDYHSISGRILKLDILGHDAPTIIKRLEENTGFSADQINFDDEKTMMVFSGNKSLDIKDNLYDEESGSLGIPEFGTGFVRGILRDTKPKTFFELAKICGVAHGTNVWNDNAETLIKSGICTLKESICVRDEIMSFLIRAGLKSKDAFDITEKVRKGNGVSSEHEVLMRENKIPDWYIDSCKKISYMFPLAHSVAYVMMSFRIAYYKVYYPLAFYSAYFSSKIDSFDTDIVVSGKSAIWSEVDRLKNKDKTEDISDDLSQNDEISEVFEEEDKSPKKVEAKSKKANTDKLYVLEIAKEMTARGFTFKACDINKSEAEVFKIEGNSLLIPFKAVNSLGEKAAFNIVEYRKKHDIYSIDDIRKIDGVNKTAIENLKSIGSLDDFPESSQFTLDMFM